MFSLFIFININASPSSTVLQAELSDTPVVYTAWAQSNVALHPLDRPVAEQATCTDLSMH